MEQIIKNFLNECLEAPIKRKKEYCLQFRASHLSYTLETAFEEIGCKVTNVEENVIFFTYQGQKFIMKTKLLKDEDSLLTIKLDI